MGVSLRRWRRRMMNAAWTVHRILQDSSTSVLLHSAAYGRYLAATQDPVPPGHISLRATGAARKVTRMWEEFPKS